jgi:hypothetical protein
MLSGWVSSATLAIHPSRRAWLVGASLRSYSVVDAVIEVTFRTLALGTPGVATGVLICHPAAGQRCEGFTTLGYGERYGVCLTWRYASLVKRVTNSARLC